MKTPLSTCILLISSMLCACSGGNTTTLLDIDNEAINLNLPDRIESAIESGIFNNSLRPEVTINDDAVSVNRGLGNQWSGSINLPVNAQYTVTVIWVETYQLQRLPLAIRTTDVLVSADGSTEEVGGSGSDYTFDDFNDDNDGRNNLVERTDDDPNTDPLIFD